MVYVSLYRKYRPGSFAEVVGQDHVTRTLANAIAEDRLHHAYLFTGPRGTGKTSTARLLAKAVNCEQGPTPIPCRTCDLCVSIADGTSVDVIELDMASHGGVDDARELRERALFAPARARRKVYILDEVHMASTAAFNALLKLIEEPPPHVLFAMATTDPQKVIPTIMSRVQRLDLRRIPATELTGHVRRIAELEGFTIEDAAVDAVVRAGDGSARDTLSVLDQVRSYTGGEVTAEKVAEVLGHTPAERVVEAVDLLAGGDLAGLLGLVQRLLDGGHDLRRFALDLVGHLRDLLVLQVAPDRPDLVDATVERRAQLATQAALLPREALVDAVGILADTLAEQRRGPARLPLELALARMAGPAVAAAVTPAAPPPPPAQPAPPVPPVPPDPEPSASAGTPAEPPVAAPPAADTEPPAELDLATVVARWPQVLDEVRAESVRLHAIAHAGTPTALDDRTVVLSFRHDFHAQEVGRAESLATVRAAASRVLGHDLVIRTDVAGDAAPSPPPPPAAVTDEEEAAVREAEDDPADHVDEEGAVTLLREQLGAAPLE